MKKRTKKTLDDRTVKAAKPRDKPYEKMEGDGFGLRVLPKGTKTFILQKRYPGSDNPARRTLGHYPMMTLADARKKAGQWVELIDRGIDPAIEKKRLSEAHTAAEKARNAATTAAALDIYCKRRLSKIRSGREVEATLRRAMADWLDRPIADVTARDVKAVILAIADRGHEGQAHQTFALIRAFFNWTIDCGDFGIETSPCARLKPQVLIGKYVIRKRVLSDAEIASYWKAAGAMPYPDGPFLKLLMMSACRLREVAQMRRREVDFKDGLFTIPALRMKGVEDHAVPLVPAIRELLEGSPHGIGGDFVFSNTGGLQPIGGFGRIQARLHKAMRADLEAQGEVFEHFVLHDVRRTCRTQFSRLRIPSEVKEALLAHAKPGLKKIYDQHEFLDEKAEGLDLWHARLREIVPPPPDNNVVPLRALG